MAVKKSKKPTAIGKPGKGSANGQAPSYQESIRRHLSTVPGVDAVYTWIDPRKVVHVTSVIEDFKEEIFDALIPKENWVEKENPGVYFDFHTHARQAGSVEATVPLDAQLIFKK
jgi:hypothetical protein